MPDRNGKIFYTSITSLSHISKIDRYIVIGTNHGDNPGEIADELKRTINKMDYFIPLKEWQVSEGIDVRLYLIRTAEFSNDPGKCFLLLGM